MCEHVMAANDPVDDKPRPLESPYNTLRIDGGQPSGHSAAATRICLTSGRTSDGMGIP